MLILYIKNPNKSREVLVNWRWTGRRGGGYGLC